MRQKIKNLVSLTTLAFLIFAMPAGCSRPQSAGSQPEGKISVNLRLAHFWPASHPAETELAQGLANLFEEVTGGQITITSYPGETLLAAAEIYDGVCTGVADIGISCFAYTRGRFPLMEVFELPGVVYNNSKVASKVAWEGIREINPAEVQDTKLLMVIATGPGDLLTRTPVKTLEDIQGMEIRATGLSAKTLGTLGATPVAMPQSDAYESIAKGVVQGNLSPQETLQGWRQAEVIKHVTLTPFLYNTLFFVTMNQNVWDSIPAHLQTAIAEAVENFFDDVAIGLWDRQNKLAIEFAIKECNVELIKLTDVEQARWINFVKPIQVDFIKEMAALGLNGSGALKVTQKLADNYNAIYK